MANRRKEAEDYFLSLTADDDSDSGDGSSSSSSTEEDSERPIGMGDTGEYESDYEEPEYHGYSERKPKKRRAGKKETPEFIDLQFASPDEDPVILEQKAREEEKTRLGGAQAPVMDTDRPLAPPGQMNLNPNITPEVAPVAPPSLGFNPDLEVKAMPEGRPLDVPNYVPPVPVKKPLTSDDDFNFVPMVKGDPDPDPVPTIVSPAKPLAAQPPAPVRDTETLVNQAESQLSADERENVHAYDSWDYTKGDPPKELSDAYDKRKAIFDDLQSKQTAPPPPGGTATDIPLPPVTVRGQAPPPPSGKAQKNKYGLYPSEHPKNFIVGQATKFGYQDPEDNGVGSSKVGGLSTNNTTLYGIAIPQNALIAVLGRNPGRWRSARVDIIDPSTGRRLRVPIVDLGPSESQVASGYIADLTEATDRFFGNEGGKKKLLFKIVPNAGPDVAKNPKMFAHEQAAIREGYDSSARDPSLVGSGRRRAAAPPGPIGMPVPAARMAALEQAQQYGLQGQADTFQNIVQKHDGDLIGAYKELEVSKGEDADHPELSTHLNDNFKTLALDSLKKGITEEVRYKYPELKTDEEAWKKAQSPGILDPYRELWERFSGTMKQIGDAASHDAPGVEREHLNIYVNQVLGPNATEEQKQDYLTKFFSMDKAGRAAEIEKHFPSPPPGTYGLTPPPPVNKLQILHAAEKLTDPTYLDQVREKQQKQRADIARELRRSPLFAGHEYDVGENIVDFIAQNGAALTQMAVNPPAYIASIQKEVAAQARANHPEWTDAQVDEAAMKGTLAQIIPQYGMALVSGPMGRVMTRLFQGLKAPASRVLATALTNTVINAGVGAGSQMGTNVATGSPIMKGAGEAAKGGAVLGAVTSAIHGPHLMAEERARLAQEKELQAAMGPKVTTRETPSPPAAGVAEAAAPVQPPLPTTGPKGAPVHGPTEATLEKGMADTQAAAPAPEPGGIILITDADGNVIKNPHTQVAAPAAPSPVAPEPGGIILTTDADGNVIKSPPIPNISGDPVAQHNVGDPELAAKLQTLEELTGAKDVLPPEAQADLKASQQTGGTVIAARRAGPPETAAMPRNLLEQAVARFRSKFRGSAPIEVVGGAHQLPAEVRQLLESQNAHGNISAFVHSHPETGDKIYVMADRQHSLQNLTGDLMEEAIGHSGVRSVLDPDQMQTLTKAIDSRFSGDRSYLRLLRQGYGRDVAAEEFLAKMAREPDRAPRFLDSAISYIAGGLRKVAGRMGLDFRITKPELRQIIAKSRTHVAAPRPERVGVMTTEPSFRAARVAAPPPPTLTEEKVRNFENATIGKEGGSKRFWKNFENVYRGLSTTPEVKSGESVPVQHFSRYIRGIDPKVQNDAANKVRHVIEPLLKVPGDVHPDLIDRLQKVETQIKKLSGAGKPVPQKLLDERKRLESFKKSSPFQLFNQKILYNDLLARSQISHGKDAAGRDMHLDLPSGLTQKEVIGRLKEINADILKLTPEQQTAIKESLTRAYRLTADVKSDLTARGFVIPKEFTNPFYYPHILLDHSEGYLSKARHATDEDFRGYLVDPVGSQKQIETNYTKAMMQHLVEVGSHNARSDAVAEYLKPLDKSASYKQQLKMENRARVLAGQQPLPSRAWEDMARKDGLEIYAPDKRIPMRMEAMIDREKLSKQLGKQINEGDLVENLKKMGVTLTAEDLHTAMAAGAREKWALTPEVHDAVRGVMAREEAAHAEKSGWGHKFAQLSSKPLAAWKWYKLHSPTAAFRYHYGNFISDAEKVFTEDPTVFKYLTKAYGMMKEFNRTGKAPNAAFAKALEHDVISAPTTQEVNTLRRELPQFEDMMTGKEKNFTRAKAFFGMSQRFGDTRESVTRLAKYLADLDRLNAGKTYRTGDIPASALFRDLDAHRTNEAKAAQNARETFIDYKAISPAGQVARKHLIPFYSYIEGNARQQINTYRNFADLMVPNKTELLTKRALRVAGTGISKALFARSVRGFLARVATVHALVNGWNGYVKSRDGIKDNDIGAQDRRRMHILWGKGEDGKVSLSYFPNAEEDLLSWVGGGAFSQLAYDYMTGKIGLKEAATDWIKAVPKDDLNKIVSSIRPEVKTGLGAAMGRDLFPDVTDPHKIQKFDMPNWLLSQVFDKPTADAVSSLTDPNFYRSQSMWDTGKQIVLQIRRRDPEQWAFYDMQDKAQQFLEAHGYEGGGGTTTPSTQTLRNFKRAVFNGDIEAAQKFAQTLVEKYGYDSKNFAASIQNMEPLHGIKKDLKPEFMKTLSDSDLEELDKAYAYYARIRGDTNKAKTEAEAIFGPHGRPKVSREGLAAAISAARDAAKRAKAGTDLRMARQLAH